jgi:hypothetical protein
MCRIHKLAILACIFLTACGGGSEKNKGSKDIPPPAPQSGTEIIADGRIGSF